MHSAALHNHSAGLRAAAMHHSGTGDAAHWFGAPRPSVLDEGDFCAIAFAFAFAAGLVFGGAIACDAYLIATIQRGAMYDFAAYQLARDLLPWSGAFTLIAAGVAGLGLKLAYAFRNSAATGR